MNFKKKTIFIKKELDPFYLNIIFGSIKWRLEMKLSKYLLVLIFVLAFISCGDDVVSEKGPECTDGVLTESCLEGQWYMNAEVLSVFAEDYYVGFLHADKYVLEFLSADNGKEADEFNLYEYDASGNETAFYYGYYRIPDEYNGTKIEIEWDGSKENAKDVYDASIMEDNLLVFDAVMPSAIRRSGSDAVSYYEVFVRDGFSPAEVSPTGVVTPVEDTTTVPAVD